MIRLAICALKEGFLGFSRLQNPQQGLISFELLFRELYRGFFLGVIKRDARSLDYSSFQTWHAMVQCSGDHATNFGRSP